MITLELCCGIYRVQVEYAGHFFRWDFTADNVANTRRSIAMTANSKDTPFDWLCAALLIRLIRENVK